MSSLTALYGKVLISTESSGSEKRRTHLRSGSGGLEYGELAAPTGRGYWESRGSKRNFSESKALIGLDDSLAHFESRRFSMR